MSALLSAAHELETAARTTTRPAALDALASELTEGLDALSTVLAVLTVADPRRLAPAAAALSTAVSALVRAGVTA